MTDDLDEYAKKGVDELIMVQLYRAIERELDNCPISDAEKLHFIVSLLGSYVVPFIEAYPQDREEMKDYIIDSIFEQKKGF